jgi:hypothetical protein
MIDSTICKSLLDRLANWLDRRELSVLRDKISSMEKTKIDFAPRLEYLESRDKICSEMANIIARQRFEIEKLKDAYDRKTIAQ